jgi:CRP-like cAMP-binding protein
LPLTAGFSTGATRVAVQIAGSAFRISAIDLVVALRDCPNLAARLQRFSQEFGLQTCQVAVCNRRHGVDERLARWLLTAHNHLGTDFFPVTHDSLAQILGTRRASVTDAAGILQKAGVLAYKRGGLKIRSRALLEKASCECYGIMARQTERWRIESASRKLNAQN